MIPIFQCCWIIYSKLYLRVWYYVIFNCAIVMSPVRIEVAIYIHVKIFHIYLFFRALLPESNSYVFNVSRSNLFVSISLNIFDLDDFTGNFGFIFKIILKIPEDWPEWYNTFRYYALMFYIWDRINFDFTFIALAEIPLLRPIFQYNKDLDAYKD